MSKYAIWLFVSVAFNNFAFRFGEVNAFHEKLQIAANADQSIEYNCQDRCNFYATTFRMISVNAHGFGS